MTGERPSWLRIVRSSLSAYERAVLANGEPCSDPSVVARLVGPRIGREEVEVMYVLALDGRHRVKHLAEISRGGLHGCSISARDILRVAIVAGASGIVLVHQHPSGDPKPSPEDLELTARVQAAGLVVGVELIDHVILAGTRRFSFIEAGLLL